MHILFIYPPYKKEEVFSYLSDNAPILPPLGIAYLAAYLRQHSYTVSIIDAPVMNLSIGQIVKKALSENPQVIGITANSPLYSRVLILARELKLSLPDCKIVLGGYHPTFLGEDVLKNNFVDFIVRGEGEKTLLALVRALEGKEDYSQIKGLGFRFQDKIVLNEPMEFISDLDCLPFPLMTYFQLKNIAQETALMQEEKRFPLLRVGAAGVIVISALLPASGKINSGFTLRST